MNLREAGSGGMNLIALAQNCGELYRAVFRTQQRAEPELETERRERKRLHLRGARNCSSGFKGSQAVPARPSGRSNSYDRNKFFYMTLEGLH
jgi:hypothetical protein